MQCTAVPLHPLCRRISAISMGACSSAPKGVVEITKKSAELDSDRTIQESMHAVRQQRLEVEKAAVAGATSTKEVMLTEALSPEEISKMVSPTATLPTVEKIYAPNVYPFPPIPNPVPAAAVPKQDMPARKSSAGLLSRWFGASAA